MPISTISSSNSISLTAVALGKNGKYFTKSYEVIFTNGNKVEFDKKGNWEERIASTPPYLLPLFLPPFRNM